MESREQDATSANSAGRLATMDVKRYCAACRDEMVFFPSGGGTTGPDGLYECIRADCELRGMSQPEQEGQSIAGFGKDETVTIIRNGPVSQNEDNLSAVKARMQSQLPNRVIMFRATGAEIGRDLIVRCEICTAERDVQVTRAVIERFAQKSRDSKITSATFSAEELVECIRAIVDKKTKICPDAVRVGRILAIDATVDVFWTVILGGLEATRSFLSGRDWFSLVFVTHSAVVIIDGKEMEQWCHCGGTGTACVEG